MKNLFGPRNSQEAEVYAIEGLLAETQYCIQSVMNGKKVNRSELARRLGCTPANVSQMLSEYSNLTLESVARIFNALDDKCTVKSLYLENRQQSAVAVDEDNSQLHRDVMVSGPKMIWGHLVKGAYLEHCPQGAVAVNEDNYATSRAWIVDCPYKAGDRLNLAGSVRVKDKPAGYSGSIGVMGRVSASNPDWGVAGADDDAEYRDQAA